MAAAVVVVVVVVAIFVAVIIAASAPNFAPKPKEKFDAEATMDAVIEEAKSGDLIFLSGDTRSERAIRFWSGSSFSHVLLVLRDAPTAEAYAFEADVGGGYRDGTRVMPLREKLEKWFSRGTGVFRVGMWSRADLRRYDHSAAIAATSRLLHLKMDKKMFAWVFPGMRSPNAEEGFCSEVVAEVLREAGVDLGPEPAVTFSPERLRRRIRGKEVWFRPS